MRKQFKDSIIDLAKNDSSIVLLFGDVSVYLFKEFQQKYPDRFYNIGICENTIITLAAGLSAQGFCPLVHTIVPFITERSFEQIKLDICYNRFPVNIVSCGASFDYSWDGPTHNSYTDLAILRLLPNIEVMQPGSHSELDTLLRSQYNSKQASYFRLSDHPHQLDLPVKFGRANIIKDCGAQLTVMTAGPILGNVLPACNDLDVNLVYFSTIKPIDRQAIMKFRDSKILVIHDAFGLYEAICEVPGLSISYHGLPDEFCNWYGTVKDIRKKLQLDTPSIKKIIKKNMNNIAKNKKREKCFTVEKLS